MSRHLRLGTRSSALAIAQSRLVAAALERTGASVELVALDSSGDHDSRPLPGRGLAGIFVDGVRGALLAGEVDFVVHSLKDVPCIPVPGLVTAAVPHRADPRDDLVSPLALGALPTGARVGTCSVRRSAWLARVRPDLDVRPLRGPIDDRIDQLRRGEFAAIVLAAAGLDRLGMSTPGRHAIAVDDLVPAPAQGALALECRRADLRTRRLLQPIDHLPTRLAVAAERAVLAAVDPTESSAVGAIATLRGSALHLLADLAAPTGDDRRVVRRTIVLKDPNEDVARTIGLSIADELLGQRAQERAS